MGARTPVGQVNNAHSGSGRNDEHDPPGPPLGLPILRSGYRHEVIPKEEPHARVSVDRGSSVGGSRRDFLDPAGSRSALPAECRSRDLPAPADVIPYPTRPFRGALSFGHLNWAVDLAGRCPEPRCSPRGRALGAKPPAPAGQRVRPGGPHRVNPRSTPATRPTRRFAPDGAARDDASCFSPRARPKSPFSVRDWRR